MPKPAAPCIAIFQLLNTGASPRSFDCECWGQIPTGGGGGGGVDSGESKPPNPKIVFLVGFRPLYLGNIGKSKNGQYSEHFLLKSRCLSMSPQNCEPEERFPHPAVGDAHDSISQTEGGAFFVLSPVITGLTWSDFFASRALRFCHASSAHSALAMIGDGGILSVSIPTDCISTPFFIPNRHLLD